MESVWTKISTDLLLANVHTSDRSLSKPEQTSPFLTTSESGEQLMGQVASIRKEQQCPEKPDAGAKALASPDEDSDLPVLVAYPAAVLQAEKRVDVKKAEVFERVFEMTSKISYEKAAEIAIKMLSEHPQAPQSVKNVLTYSQRIRLTGVKNGRLREAVKSPPSISNTFFFTSFHQLDVDLNLPHEDFVENMKRARKRKRDDDATRGWARTQAFYNFLMQAPVTTTKRNALETETRADI